MSLVKCPECGRENISDRAKECPSCSFPIEEYFNNEGIDKTQNKTLQKCRFCGSMSIDSNGYCNSCGMDTSDNKAKTKYINENVHSYENSYDPANTISSIGGTNCKQSIWHRPIKSKPVVIIICLVIIIWGIWSCSKERYSESDNSMTKSKTQKEILMDAGMTEKQAAEIMNVCSTAKAPKIVSVKYFSDTESGGVVYEMDIDDLSSNWMACFDKKGHIDEINVKFSSAQIYADGKVQVLFLSAEEKNKWRVTSQLIVNDQLKAPKTAEYPSASEWSIFSDLEIVRVASYVDAQNSFGAMIRSEFMITFDHNGKILSFIFDGKELAK